MIDGNLVTVGPIGANESDATGPKRLVLYDFGIDEFSFVGDSSWVWRTCGQMEELEVNFSSRRMVHSIAKGIRTMPCLDRVIFGRDENYGTEYVLDDVKMVPILSAGANGWGKMRFGSAALMEGWTFTALLQHASTLEELSLSMISPTLLYLWTFFIGAPSCASLWQWMKMRDSVVISLQFTFTTSSIGIDMRKPFVLGRARLHLRCSRSWSAVFLSKWAVDATSGLIGDSASGLGNSHTSRS